MYSEGSSRYKPPGVRLPAEVQRVGEFFWEQSVELEDELKQLFGVTFLLAWNCLRTRLRITGQNVNKTVLVLCQRQPATQNVTH